MEGMLHLKDCSSPTMMPHGHPQGQGACRARSRRPVHLGGRSEGDPSPLLVTTTSTSLILHRHVDLVSIGQRVVAAHLLDDQGRRGRGLPGG